MKSVMVLVVVGLTTLGYVHSSKEIMKNMTASFTKVLEECKKEVITNLRRSGGYVSLAAGMNIPEHVMQDFYNFWREEFSLVNRELGCAIMCMASKFDMITDDYNLHHGNAHQFAKQHGADDDMAKQLVIIIHECEQTTEQAHYTDDCVRVLEIAKCFRIRIHELKWAPTMEVALEEVMSDV